MATDYYRMGRDLGGAWFEGLERGRSIKRQEELDRQRNELHEAQMQGLRRQRAMEQEQDAAFREYTDLSQNGVVDAAGTGLSQPSAQFIASGNAGFGTGERAVQEAAGMYQREMNRFAQAPAAPDGGLPKYDATAPVTRRAASEIEREQALGRVSAAQRDARGLRDSNERVTKLKFDEGYKKYADTLLTDMRALGPKGFIDKHGAALNANGNVDGYMTFDERSGKIAVATKEGVTMMDPADVLAYQLGAYKLGNGKVEEGIALMTGASDRNQKRITDALATARDVIKTQVGAWKAGKDVENDAARTAAYRASISARAGAKERTVDDVPKELRDRMYEIEVKIRDPKLQPTERAALAQEYEMLTIRANQFLGRSSGLPRARGGLSPEKELEAAMKVSAESGIPLPAAIAQVRAIYGGEDLSENLLASLQTRNKTAEENRGAGLRVPGGAPSRLPPPEAPARRQAEQAASRFDATQQRNAEAVEWQRVAGTVNLDTIRPTEAAELLRRFGHVMPPADRRAITQRAN
ncbi:MAG: hypothetical protein AB7S63_15795 [Thauera sp.]